MLHAGYLHTYVQRKMGLSLIFFGFMYTCRAATGLAPEFLGSISNLTTSQGRDASFACSVRNLGGYRVAWIKSDTKAILAIHDHVITNNARLDITHNDKDTWTLTLRDVQTSDRGPYMCQVNSTPVRSQIAHLEVVIPPRIEDEQSSSDVAVPEGGSVKLNCRAEGFPKPTVTWRRPGGEMITVRKGANKMKAEKVAGEVIHLHKVTRSEMGSYMCIANNGVPPAVSKTVQLNVNFQPQISAPVQLIGARRRSEQSLSCTAEASPKPINYWTFGTGEMIVANEKFLVKEEPINSYKFRMTLTIKHLQGADFGTYRCISKNSIGQAKEVVELYELAPEVLPNAPENLSDEDYDDDDDYEAPPQTPRPTHPPPKSPTYSPSSRTRGPSGAFIYRGAGPLTKMCPSLAMFMALLVLC